MSLWDGEPHTIPPVALVQAKQGTCQKRVVVCVLRDAAGTILATGVNRCRPPESGCPRIGIQSTYADYPGSILDPCHADHAEMDALRQVADPRQVTEVVIYGHTFACPGCTRLLRQQTSVTEIRVIPMLYEGWLGLGLRSEFP